ncbi:MAG: aminotransferase class I/II-fold pyridoxal phosphate-dependent enzyme [Pseudomonadota bacterium]
MSNPSKTNLPFLKQVIAERALKVPFVGPEAKMRASGHEIVARLGANESGFGPSPKAIAAMQAAAGETWKYADPTNHELRVAIADHLDLPMEAIVVGEGIDGLLGDTCKLTLEPGRTLVMSDGAYPTVEFHANIHQATVAKVPFKDLREDLDGLLDTARSKAARLLYISNPNNPLGTFWRHTEIGALVESVPETTLLLLDEAYADTAPPDAIPPLSIQHPNVLRFRTFSKAYGLAGIRVGFAIGHPDLIAQFEKVRNHYGVNLLGQVGARAAIGDQAYLIETVNEIAKARNRIEQVAMETGFETLPSATNFMTIDCREAERAQDMMSSLTEAGIFVRRPSVEKLQRFIRVTAGDAPALDIFEEAWIKSAGKNAA